MNPRFGRIINFATFVDAVFIKAGDSLEFTTHPSFRHTILKSPRSILMHICYCELFETLGGGEVSEEAL